MFLTICVVSPHGVAQIVSFLHALGPPPFWQSILIGSLTAHVALGVCHKVIIFIVDYETIEIAQFFIVFWRLVIMTPDAYEHGFHCIT